MNAGDSLFDGLRVGAFESRRAEELARMIERFGGVAHVSPSMREVPLAENQQAVDFAHRLLTGEMAAVVFLTGVGFRLLLELVQRSIPRQRFLDALADTVTIARGPKPAAAMQAAGVTPTFNVAAPHTWREVLVLIDQQLSIDNQTVAVQEYGKTNPSLTAGLEARGARVLKVPVYQWRLPEDCGPLEENVRRLAAGELDMVMFTSAHQLTNLLAIAEKLDLVQPLRLALEQTVVASIGPTTSEMLRSLNLPVDFEPTHSKMGQLVQQAAEQSAGLLQRKRQIQSVLATSNSPPSESEAAWYNSPFMKACRREPTDVTPIWLMRQAGRYMAEYRAVREKVSFLDLCKDPALCSEVMCTAVARLGVDAAIIFSDLLPILEPMGLDLEFAPGGGPIIHNPVREPADVDRVVELESVESLHFVMETVRQTRNDLPAELPVIGFAGAPFTLASYTIEGGGSRNYLHTKTLMYRDPGAWKALMERLSRAIQRYLNAQIAAGAQCVQLFDSWVGCLGTDDYRQYVLPYVQQIIRGTRPTRPARRSKRPTATSRPPSSDWSDRVA